MGAGAAAPSGPWLRARGHRTSEPALRADPATGYLDEPTSVLLHQVDAATGWGTGRAAGAAALRGVHREVDATGAEVLPALA